MPANLNPEYRKAEQEYKAAKTHEEKLACLQLMLSVIPKHKGTDKLQGDIKHRIAVLKKGPQERSRKKGPSFRIRPEGAGQITLVGPPNSGKSSILAALSRAQPDVADYPCTTREPVPGMVPFEDVQFQLVDLPPVWRGHCESFVFDNIKGSDAMIIVLDLGALDPAQDYEETLANLREKHVTPIPPQTTADDPESDARLDDLEALLVLNKGDLDPQQELLTLLKEMVEIPFPCHVVSAKERTGLQEFTEAMFRLLHVMRVYPKEPGRPPDKKDPFTVPVGSTVLDFAGRVHKDFARQLKSARVWGSAKFDGQVVQRDHVLKDGDIVELTM